MELKIRRAEIRDLEKLTLFVQNEAKESEGLNIDPETLRKGVETALKDENVALYWVLVDKNDESVGNISALREWSNFHAGFYWWIQSMYILPEYRRQGYSLQLLDTVRSEVQAQRGLELRLLVHKSNKRAIKAYTKSGFTELPYKIMTKKLDSNPGLFIRNKVKS
jgi:ribosomal protein S18 acetylase RimI-like enzyme